MSVGRGRRQAAEFPVAARTVADGLGDFEHLAADRPESPATLGTDGDGDLVAGLLLGRAASAQVTLGDRGPDFAVGGLWAEGAPGLGLRVQHGRLLIAAQRDDLSMHDQQRIFLARREVARSQTRHEPLDFPDGLGLGHAEPLGFGGRGGDPDQFLGRAENAIAGHERGAHRREMLKSFGHSGFVFGQAGRIAEPAFDVLSEGSHAEVAMQPSPVGKEEPAADLFVQGALFRGETKDLLVDLDRSSWVL
jgi:hypothetical protein